MDKAQQQLINTYFRKRAIAAKENSRYKFQNYEYDFGLKNDHIDINDLDETYYYNYLWGSDYRKISEFGKYGGDVALVEDKNNKHYFLNKQGKHDITGINLDEINDMDINTAYYNGLWGTNHMIIHHFSKFGDVTFIIDKNEKRIFVNKQGEPDVSGVNPDNIKPVRLRAAYYNTLWGTNYTLIGNFGEYGGDVALASDKNDNSFFINKQGKLDMTGLNSDSRYFSGKSYYAHNNTKELINKQNG